MTKHGNTTHGMSKSPEWKAWRGMRERCSLESRKDWDKYGGRGIVVCDRWSNSFENFFADMGLRPSSSHSLDRINYNGNYEKSNCRWATKTEQARNTRANTWYIYKGKKYLISDLCKMSGLKRKTIYYRIKIKGMSVEDALSEKIRGSNGEQTKHIH